MAREGTLMIKASVEEAAKLKGKLVFSNDGVYTSAAANDLYARVIFDGLLKLADGASPKPHELRKPFWRQNLERATLAPITEKMLTGSWQKIAPQTISPGFARHFDDIWFTNTPGAVGSRRSALTFKFKGTAASIFDLIGPDTGRARITVDGVDKGVRERVDLWCYSQRLAALPVADRLEDKEHTVTVELLPDPPVRTKPIEEARRLGRFNPKDFDGVALRFGWLRIVGELVP